ncbi:MAG: hypothetical protein EOM45_11260, partial [Clostridia bacterium]|nr:hypothetical protein [Clostridia bacterium]
MRETAQGHSAVPETAVQLQGCEVGETLLPIPGYDFEAYKDQLIERFSNPYCSDTLLRLAQDGSKKFANALVPALR